MNERPQNTLARILGERAADLPTAWPPEEEPGEADYDEAIDAVRSKARALREQVERDQARVEAQFADLADQPEGRQAAVIAESPPQTLLALAYRLMTASYACRFDDAARSLVLASLAHRVAVALEESGHLSPSAASDLVGESLDYLANARRINSDLAGAERAFADAERCLEYGTRDRHLRANHLGLLGALRHSQGRAKETAALWAREAALWRLLKDPGKLGAALLNCGLATCYAGEPLVKAAKLIRDGLELVEDDRMVFIGMVNLAEMFAREGDGEQAWRLLESSHLMASQAEMGESPLRRRRWVEGIAHRALGEPDRAAHLLESVRDEFEELGQPLFAAFVSLDLIAALAAEGKHRQLAPVSEATYKIFVAEGLDQQALSVFMIAHRAAAEARLTEELAVKVANFIALRQHNREARFE